MIDTINQSIWDVVATVFAQVDRLDLNKVKNYRLLWANFFEIDIFYTIDEKVSSFFEFNHEFEDFKTSSATVIRALDFMANVLFQGFYDKNEIIETKILHKYVF